jgi:hypothetical protein
VIALARGGALETLTPTTGHLFHDQTVDGLMAAVRSFDAWEAGFEPEAAVKQASGFGRARFLAELKREVEATLSGPPG